MSSSNFELNAEQQQAVQAPLGVQLVLAGAGSGKTQVLVQRIGYLVNNLQCNPNHILAVTFTNKAAGEMKERISELLSGNLGFMWVGTFHGLANRLLRQHYVEAGLSANFQILNSSDQKRIVKNVLNELEISEKDLPVAVATNYINQHKDEGRRPENIQLDSFDIGSKRLHAVYKHYELACARSDVIDFAEILLRTLEVLRNHSKILDYYQQRFRHILVDEFQDTNSVQYAWLRLLAGKNKSLMVVGDDDQSIYGWRGAKIENIQNFHIDFPSCNTIRLEQNYRSTSVILAAANAVIAKNGRARLGKNLWTDKSSGNKILLRQVKDEMLEGKRVAEEIINAQQNGTNLNDIAILYRANAQSRALEEALRAKQIAYKIHGDTSFYNRAEIKHAMAYLAVISNPNNNAQLSRIINFPPRAIGPKTIDLLQKTAIEQEISLWHAVNYIVDTKPLAPRAQNSLEDFVIKIKALQNKAQGLPLADLVELMLSKNYSYLIEHYLSKIDDKPQQRTDNLKELITAANNFLPEKDHITTLQSFIDQNALFTEEENEEDEEQAEQVNLMTVHRSKGLEFYHVIITGLEDGLFPLFKGIEDERQLEEERRLFYVALTRAKKHLSLYYAEARQLYGKTERGLRPSCFLKEIPTELLNKKDTKKVVEKKPFSSFSLNSHRKNLKQQQLEQANAGKYRLGQSVYHDDYGEGLVFKVSDNKIEVRINNSMYCLDENDHKLRSL